MDHKDIVQIVSSMDIKELTLETFEEFVQNAKGLFVPINARFQRWYSPGFNDSSKAKWDFSKGKPEYLYGDVEIFERTEDMKIPEQGKKWINVHFKNELEGYRFAEVWGIPHSGRLPSKFGFDSNKAIYVAEQSGNGTPRLPYETVFIKL